MSSKNRLRIEEMGSTLMLLNRCPVQNGWFFFCCLAVLHTNRLVWLPKFILLYKKGWLRPAIGQSRANVIRLDKDERHGSSPFRVCQAHLMIFMTFAKNDSVVCITLCWHLEEWSSIRPPFCGFPRPVGYKHRWEVQTYAAAKACRQAYFRFRCLNRKWLMLLLRTSRTMKY